jgi:hypothetical protein
MSSAPGAAAEWVRAGVKWELRCELGGTGERGRCWMVLGGGERERRPAAPSILAGAMSPSRGLSAHRESQYCVYWRYTARYGTKPRRIGARKNKGIVCPILLPQRNPIAALHLFSVHVGSTGSPSPASKISYFNSHKMVSSNCPPTGSGWETGTKSTIRFSCDRC